MSKIYITGGAGFIGSNIAKYHLENGDEVIVLDNLSRKGTEINMQWLKTLKGKFRFINGDVRNFSDVYKYIKKSDIIYHMAAQVAVTTSIINPRDDFEINALGTLNVLEAMRKYAKNGVLIYASTNKVYGNFDSARLSTIGISENQNLDFHSPYGCSKGSGDQYVRDYGRVYNLKTIVFRQSCIYGDRQLGNEDQGWVMHFVRSALHNKIITIYGDGKQVRDILYITDLLNAYQLAAKKVKAGIPNIYNIGGSKENSISIINLIKLLETKLTKKLMVKFKAAREGDQKIYISNNSKIETELNWSISVNKDDGIDKLISWAKSI